MLYNKTYFSFE
jgi:hypothetical protein